MNSSLQEMDLSRLLAGLRRIGADGGGVTRLVYDEAWCEAHAWLRTRGAELGLEASTDSGGSILFHPPGLTPGTPAIFCGSHMDTVKQGGAYDGAYGAVAGMLLAAMHLGHEGLPVVGYVTAEEEGSRFFSPFIGARSLLGLADGADLDAIHDSEGVAWRAALEFARSRGCAAPLAAGLKPFVPLFKPVMELELHIEQGPVLEAEQKEVGIVDTIAGFVRVDVRIRGDARHAGTTPMGMRRDALVAAAECIWSAEVLALELGEPAVATVGRAEALPGAYNVVPGECRLRLDARHSDPAVLTRMTAELEKRWRDIAHRRNIELEWNVVARSEPVAMAPGMVAEAEALAGEMVFNWKKMPSGAGHDSMIFAGAGVPSLMIFVPSHRGVSHHPDEFTAPGELWEGVRFASALLERLARSAANGGKA